MSVSDFMIEAVKQRSYFVVILCIYINIYVYVPRHIKKKCEDKALLESGARDLCASFRHY